MLGRSHGAEAERGRGAFVRSRRIPQGIRFESRGRLGRRGRFRGRRGSRLAVEGGGPGVDALLGGGVQRYPRCIQGARAGLRRLAEPSMPDAGARSVANHDRTARQRTPGRALHAHTRDEAAVDDDGRRDTPHGDARRMGRRLRLVAQAMPPFSATSRPAMRPNTRQRPRPCCAKPPCDSPAQYSPGMIWPRVSMTCAFAFVCRPVSESCRMGVDHAA